MKPASGKRRTATVARERAAASSKVVRSKVVRAKAKAAAPAKAMTPTQAARDYAHVALVLQGGGALGAYQCGVYEALHEAGIAPNWFAGTSIGAINAAILAGNPPQHRIERLHEFWDTICEPGGSGALIAASVRAMLEWLPPSDEISSWTNSLGALGALTFGQQGFFNVRPQAPILFKDGSAQATSFYDTTPLKATLERLIDFDRINAGGARLSIGATNVRSGNFHYFDSVRDTIRAEHVMASGALPPAFPAIQIDGEEYWDGGLVSNTPLDHVLAETPRRDTLVLLVDLWSARGDLPRTMMDVLERQKDIQYSSRTRLGTDHEANLHRLRHAIRRLFEQVPPGSVDAQLRQTLQPWVCNNVVNIVHLIYQAKPYEAQFKDYAFGLGTQREHWAAGRTDMQRTLEHPDYFSKPPRDIGVATHDVHRLVAARREHA
jgi:NTE family protein